MIRMVQSILAGYGSPVTIEHETAEPVQTRAFVQPVRSIGWQNMQRVMHALGEGPVGQFVYIGPAAAVIAPEDIVVCSGRRLRVRRCETMELAGQPVYFWALLSPDGGDDPWNS